MVIGTGVCGTVVEILTILYVKSFYTDIAVSLSPVNARSSVAYRNHKDRASSFVM